MSERLKNALERLGSPSIFVIGDIILDKYVWGSVNRISPEAPIQVLNIEKEEYRLGGAANVANNIASLGAKVCAGGCIGSDNDSKTVLSLFRKAGINSGGVVIDKNKPTSLKTRMLSHSHQMLRVDREDTNPISRVTEHQLLRASHSCAQTYDMALISDYNKGTLTKDLCAGIIDEFKRVKKPILVSPKVKDFRKYKYATGATLNRVELSAIFDEDNINKGAKHLIKELNLSFALITLGDKGMALYKKDGESWHLPALAKEVYDVTGAGDTVLSILGLSYASGNSLEESVELANIAASIAVGKVGTEIVTKDELLAQIMPSLFQKGDKIVLQRELLEILERERKTGKRVIFTNGCFDILHTGHISTLQYARSKGDLLVVGMNSDSSVRRLKGKNRPINSQDQRSRLLASMEAVDYITIFENDTPLELIKAIKPDVLVKGADWKGDKIVGKDFIARYGGKVEVAPLIKGVSTTGIIEEVKKRR